MKEGMVFRLRSMDSDIDRLLTKEFNIKHELADIAQAFGMDSDEGLWNKEALRSTLREQTLRAMLDRIRQLLAVHGIITRNGS